MIETMFPQPPDLWATVPAPDLAALLEQVAPQRRENAALRAENAALRAENVALQERVRELAAALLDLGTSRGLNGYHSPNSAQPTGIGPGLPTNQGRCPQARRAQRVTTRIVSAQVMRSPR